MRSLHVTVPSLLHRFTRTNKIRVSFSANFSSRCLFPVAVMREPLVDRLLNACSRLLFVVHGMSAGLQHAYEIAAQLIAFFVRWITRETMHIEEEVNLIVVPIVGR